MLDTWGEFGIHPVLKLLLLTLQVCYSVFLIVQPFEKEVLHQFTVTDRVMESTLKWEDAGRNLLKTTPKPPTSRHCHIIS